ncbi:hypothetical protein NW754_002263 [Fusarium falciforme]|uniref:BZIP domain-containing protein n=1 Tax=Fusarium falciforme TaxID=195108 RepID=A0A9W8UUH6_9HYPO|nr:hypothetical protein NW754_002263 [Fusarium falciforme]KAJ4175719.1 hypothetical protein NW767_015691 [Fusarium falciforme]KAJ4175860.1 hypothetical protein NW755_014721 [Fusarium falciforme]KAJ4214843.1 hypothetical protein NW757_014713 [Fusarium falciforme]
MKVVVNINAAFSSPSSSTSPCSRPISPASSHTINMTRPSSAGPPRPNRKGARSVSTLTPSQLARKRANDREAQRVIRARTKEHIERLERELEERKSMQSRDQTVQELLRRNKALEEELIRLKESREVPMTSSPYCVPVCDGNPSTGSDAIPSPRGSSFSDDCNSIPDYSQQYVPLPNNCESWASTVPCPVPSKASSPSSSADNYSTGYIPTSVPTSILPSNNTSSLSISAVGHKDIAKMEYDGVFHHATIPQGHPLSDVRPGEEVNHTLCLDAGFCLSNFSL